MNDGIGFDLLDIVPDLQSRVIFVTGSSEYAIKAFQYSAIDYIMKPVEANLLIKAVEKVVLTNSPTAEQVNLLKSSYKQSKPYSKMALHTTEQILVTDIKDIIRLESTGNYTQFYFVDGSKILITKTLKTYDSLLTEAGFMRVHQSHLVNMDYVKAYIKTEGGYLTMKDESMVPVSVRKKAVVMERLG